MSLAQVKEFHTVFGHPVAKEPQLISEERFLLRIRLVFEELDEIIDAWEQNDVVKYADGLADLSVVVNGAILEFGGDSNSIDEVDFSVDADKIPHLPEHSHIDGWARLFRKDVNLIEDAYTKSNLKEVIYRLQLCAYSVAYMAQFSGIPLTEINDAVHIANMSKLGEDGKPVYRETDNKILKGPNFQPPEKDIRAILEAHGAQL